MIEMDRLIRLVMAGVGSLSSRSYVRASSTCPRPFSTYTDDDHRSLVRLLHDDVGAFAQSLDGGAFGRIQILEDLVSRPTLGQSSSRSRYVRLEGGVFRGRRLPFRDRSERRWVVGRRVRS